MRKKISFLILAIILTLMGEMPAFAAEAVSVQVSAADAGLKLCSTEADGGLIFTGLSSSDDKLMVSKGDWLKFYDLRPVNGEFSERVYLTQGKGDYTITLCRKLLDNRYAIGAQINICNQLELNEFLVPDQYIEADSGAISNLAAELTKDKESNADKARVLYDWVKDSIVYDYALFLKHQEGDFENEYGALKALETGKGVCFDFAALVAALGRSQGIQVKLVKGWKTIGGIPQYHAWNEVFIPEENRWLELDATFAATSDRDYFDCGSASLLPTSADVSVAAVPAATPGS